MTPIVTKGTNSVFGLDGYEKLPGEIYEEDFGNKKITCVQTVWQLSDEEMKILEKTGKIFISTVGEAPQPIDVSVESFTKSSGFRPPF